MTGEAKSFLLKMASEFEDSGRKTFDTIFRFDCSDDVLNELENRGYIIIENDIAATTKLTKTGYEAAKK